MNLFWQALSAVFVLAAKLGLMKAAGAHGTVRTKIVWEGDDGTSGEIPFYSFRI